MQSSFSDIFRSVTFLKLKGDLKHNTWSHMTLCDYWKTERILQPLPPELGH